MICGDNAARFPEYRTGFGLTQFFARAGVSRFKHDGSTRKWWTLGALKECNEAELNLIIIRLGSPKEYKGDSAKTSLALKTLREILSVEGLTIALNGVVPQIIKGTPTIVVPQEAQQAAPIKPPDFASLGLEQGIAQLLQNRWIEAQICVDAKAYLAATILMGSLLEGLLLAVCQRLPKSANQAPCAPKDVSGKVKYFVDWSFSEMIEVAHAVGWIGLDVKKFSHSLREFPELGASLSPIHGKGVSG